MNPVVSVAAECLLSLALVTAPRPQAPEHAEPVSRAEPEILLEGVIVTANPDSSLVLVRRAGAPRGRSARIGDTVYGWMVVDITDGSALFERNGERLQLYLDGGPSVIPPVAASPSDTKIGTEPVGETAEVRSGVETWVIRELDRSHTEERLKKEMPTILSETGISPRAEAEKSGLQITHLPDGTLLSDLGLQPGDVLLSINDVSLDSLTTLAGLYPALRSENEIRVVVERSGHILKLSYDLR